MLISYTFRLQGDNENQSKLLENIKVVKATVLYSSMITYISRKMFEDVLLDSTIKHETSIHGTRNIRFARKVSGEKTGN